MGASCVKQVTVHGQQKQPIHVKETETEQEVLSQVTCPRKGEFLGLQQKKSSTTRKLLA
jgi:hypothetical protein